LTGNHKSRQTKVALNRECIQAENEIGRSEQIAFFLANPLIYRTLNSMFSKSL
jgi:hypothetical protein